MQGTVWPSSFVRLPDAGQLRERWVGTAIDELPTPVALIDRGKMVSNIAEMEKTVSDWQCLFRAHIKTHKTREGTLHQLAPGNRRSLIVSTLAEAWGVVECGLINEGIVDDILYGLPVGVHKLPEILDLRRAIQSRAPSADIKLLVDNIAQVDAVEEALQGRSDRSGAPLSVYIKIDSGYHRAGLTVTSTTLPELVKRIDGLDRVAIWGVYCHAGHSYSSSHFSTASSFLTTELQCTNEAAQIVQDIIGRKNSSRHRSPLVLSVGCTPTAHAARGAPSNEELCQLRRELHGDLELHAGNYPFLDLQQVATGAVPSDEGQGAIERCSFTVLASVLSLYPGRGAGGSVDGDRPSLQARLGDEALCDAGGLTLSKDTGQYDGFGHVVAPPRFAGWKLGRIAQEHGVLTLREGGREQWSREWGCSPSKEAGQMLRVSDKVQLVPQHACMVAAAHPFFFIIDSTLAEPVATVQDVWVPWKGW